ncbi:MAG: hypothetical protein RL767_372 [Bacteroidota bacterium]
MLKNLLIATGAIAILASCQKERTLDEQLSGTWNLSDLSLSGTVITPVGALPITITDSLIRPNNYMDLAINEDETQTIYWNMDVRGLITAPGLGSFGTEIQDTINGTWYAVDGGGVTPDSLYITADGEKNGYEILSFLETSLRLRSVQTIVDPDLGSQTFTQEVTFIK